MTFFNICEILLCIVGFYPIVFFTLYYTHCSIIYTFIVLLSYLMLVIYIIISVAVCSPRVGSSEVIVVRYCSELQF